MKHPNHRTFQHTLLKKNIVWCIQMLLSPVAMCLTVSFLGTSAFSTEVDLSFSTNSVVNKSIVDTAVSNAATYFNNNPTGSYIINFPAGTWTIHHPNTYGIHIQNLNTSATNPLILRGAGSAQTVLQFDQFDQFGIFLEETPFVTIEDMHITRCRSTVPNLNPEDIGLYCTQGDVVSVDPGHIVFQLHEGFPDPVWLMKMAGPDQERTLSCFTHADPLHPQFSPKEDRIALSEIICLTNSLYDAVLLNTNQVANLNPGDWVALKTKCGVTTVRTHNCDDFIIQDVLFTRASNCALMLLRGSDRGTVRRVAIDRSPPINGKAPCYSSPGGGPQINADTEGPLVENCYINATADDGIAVFSYTPSSQIMSNSVICNNIVNDVCGRGIDIINCKDGICSGNIIRRGREMSIAFASTSTIDCLPSAACENWHISNNIFIQPWSYSVIGCHLTAVACGRYDELYIENNTFLDAPKNNALVDIDFCDHAYINNNRVLSFSTAEDVAGPENRVPQPTAAMVYVSDSLNVSGTNNYCAESTGRLPYLTSPDNPGTVDVEWIGTDIVGGGGVCLAIADAQTIENGPDNNYGDAETLDVRAYSGLPRKRYSYLKFCVTGANLPILSAKLRIYSEDANMSVAAHAVSDTSWSEDTITWNTKPPLEEILNTQTSIPGEWVEFDVTDHVTSNGIFSIGLSSANTADDAAALNFLSRETRTIPHLVLECTSVIATTRFYSVSTEDGYIVESGENTDEGILTTVDRDDASALRIGDTIYRKQWLSVVSFDTSSLEGARILSATLGLTRGGKMGDPSGFGKIIVDQKSDSGFSDNAALEASDFEAPFDIKTVAILPYPLSNWEVTRGTLNWGGRAYINRTEKTQFRIRFETDDDNDDDTDFLGFYSGKSSVISNRPVLEVVYEL